MTEWIGLGQLLTRQGRTRHNIVRRRILAHIHRQQIFPGACPGLNPPPHNKRLNVKSQAKNERDNITQDDLATFKKAAKEYLSLTDAQIAAILENQAITEVK